MEQLQHLKYQPDGLCLAIKIQCEFKEVRAVHVSFSPHAGGIALLHFGGPGTA